MQTDSIPHAMAGVGKKRNNLKLQPHRNVNKVIFVNVRNLVAMACDQRGVRGEVLVPFVYV